MLLYPHQHYHGCVSGVTAMSVVPWLCPVPCPMWCGQARAALTFVGPHTAEVLTVVAPLIEGPEDVVGVPRDGMGQHILEGTLLP